jgi:hypothetical protein
MVILLFIEIDTEKAEHLEVVTMQEVAGILLAEIMKIRTVLI